MFNVGSQELLIIFVLVFLLFGPKHIPEVAHTLGKGLGELRRTLQGVEDSVRRGVTELPDPPNGKRPGTRDAGLPLDRGPSPLPQAQEPRTKEAAIQQDVAHESQEAGSESPTPPGKPES